MNWRYTPLARDTVIENMGDGVIVLDTQGRIVDLNPAAAQIIGHEVSEAIGRPAAELLPVRPGLIERCHGVTEVQKEIIIGEGEAQCRYDLRFSPLYDRRRRLIGYLILLRDITGQRGVEDALQEREVRLRVTMEQMPAVLWTTDTELRFTSSVGAGLAALNLRPNQVVGMTLFEYFQTDEPEFPAIAAHRHALMGKSVTYEQEWAGNLYHSHVEPLRDAEGRIVGCIGLALDITERRQAEEALRRRDTILEAVSFAAEQLLKTTVWDQRIQAVLARLGEATGVSRVYIFENHVDQDGTLLTSQRYEWAAPGIEPQIDNPDLQNFPWHAGGFGRWEDTLSRGELIFGHVREFPASEREVLASQGILSILVVPIFVGEALWGFIGFDECLAEREWAAAEMEALRAAAGILGAAIQRTQAESTLRRRAKELHTLHAISLDISAPNELPTLLHTIVERATHLLNAPGGGLYLCDPERQEARCVVSYNTLRDYTGTVLKYGEGAAGIVAQTGEPLIIDDYRTWPGRAAVYEEEQPFTAVLSAPMMWQGQVIGVIHVLHNVEVRRFTQADLELLSLLASQAAIAVENARLLEAERKQRKEAQARTTELRERQHYLALLNDITLVALETSDFQAMLQTLADRLGELIHADGCYIVLWDEEQQRAIPKAAYGPLHEMYPTVQVEPGEVTMTESVLRVGHPLVAEDVYNSPYLSPRIAAMFPARSLLGLPLIADDQKLGAVLIAFNEPHHFTPDEIAKGEQAARQIALAIAKARALEAERRRADELDALRDIIADILTEHELPNLLRTLLERTVALLNATGGDLGLYDEAAQELVIIVSHNMGKDYAGTRMALSEGAMGQVMQTGKPVLIDDYTTWEQRSPQYADGPWHAVMAAPLISGGRLIGALGIVDSDPQRKFTPSDLRLLGLLADQAAIVVEKARLLKEAQIRARRQAALVQLSVDLAAALDEEEICHRVVQRLHDTLGYAYQGIFLIDESTGDRVLCAGVGWPDAPTNWRIPPGQGVSERAILDGQLHYTPDVTKEPNYVPGLNSGAEVDVPIRVGGKVVGVLVVESQEPNAFGPEDFELLEAAANQAGIAMSNARLLQESQRRAEEAETLRRAGAVVAAALEQDEAIQRILEQLELVVPYDSASVQLLREGYVEIVGGRGWPDPATVVGLRFPVPGDNPNTVVIQERRPYILNNAPAAHAPFREDPHSHIRSWLGVPLLVGDRVIGMLTVDSKHPGHFTSDHARLVTAFANQVAITLENARLFEAQRRRNEELEILHQASLHLTSSLELQPVLGEILQHALKLTAATDAHIFLYDGERLSFGAALWANGREETPYVEPRPNGLTYTVARTGERIVVDDVDRHPLFQDWPWGGAIAGLPLRIGNRVCGVMNVAFGQPHSFDEEELRVLELLADQAAIALENARLFEAEQRRRKVAATLLEITEVAGSSLELRQILKQITRLTAEACQTDRCSIFLLDNAQEYLQPVMSQFADGHVEPEMWQRFKTTTADRVDVVPLFREAIRQRRPIQLDDPARTDLIPRKWTEPFGIQKLLLVPLISHERVIGMMALDYTDAKREFTPEQVELAQTISGQIAVSIENAQLYAKTQQLAITDSLTGLYNRRGFFELGRREVERARRFGRPLSAIMLDLDHFKLVNDTYGHHIGDQVLAELAACCRQVLRDVDLLGRYGGEEFTFLLPETGVAAAQPVAERLRRHVERSLMSTDRGPISITISLGVAQLDETCPDLEALLERADQALYVAKRSGRNQVRVWQANDQDVP